eukprot:6200592-Pleurochrysis_carterae.AAC.3
MQPSPLARRCPLRRRPFHPLSNCSCGTGLCRRPIYRFVESELEAVGHAPCVVLVPSLRDATHSPVFPQLPLPLRVPAHLRESVLLAPNPCTLDLGGVAVGCSSLDVLMLLGQQELSSKPKASALMRRAHAAPRARSQLVLSAATTPQPQSGLPP